jgi:glycosyltransferase involved in cell wall biosynthesis
VGSKLRFLGRVPGPERWYSAADAFVLPTWYEPFGMVIVEAMAAGLPVITSAAAGAVEGFSDGREGVYLRDAFSGDELAGAIFRVRQDDTLRGSLIREGRSAAGKLGWPDVAARTLRVYRRVAGGEGAHP